MKTSRLSLAAITALGLSLSTNSLSANELIDITLPDNQWKLIGVNGGFEEGSSTADLDSTWTTVTETNNDNLFTGIDSGITPAAADDYIQFKVINHNGLTEPSEVKLSFDTSSAYYEATAPFRTMYVSADGSGTADIHILYQSQYEGETFDMSIDMGSGAVIYRGTFTSTATKDTPLTLTAKTNTIQNPENVKLKIADIIDMDLSNNPGYFSSLGSTKVQSGTKNDYLESLHRDEMNSGTASDEKIKVYRYDSISKSWGSYNSENTNNDFDSLVPGSSYWVKLDNDSRTQPGIVLGSGQIEGASTYTDANLLNDGWNMLSFNNGKIRESSTGLKVTLERNSTAEFTLTDAFGKQSIDINVSDQNLTVLTQKINYYIEKEIEEGDSSENLNIRVYPASEYDGTDIVIVSDKRFIIKPMANAYGPHAITTLAGKIPHSVSTGAEFTTALTDVNSSTLDTTVSTDFNTSGAMSVYGEYALAVTINGVTGNSSNIVNGPLLSDGPTTSGPSTGKLEYKATDQTSASTPTLGGQASISAINGAIGTSNFTNTITLDTDFSEGLDTILLVDNSARFYVKDHTFTRVYEADLTGATTSTKIWVDANGASNEINTGTKIRHLDGNISSITGIDSNSSVDQDGSSGTIFVVTDDSSLKDFDIKDASGDDFLTLSTSNDAMAKGAITTVYSLDNLAKATTSAVSGRATSGNITMTAFSGNDDFNVSSALGVDGNFTSMDINISYNNWEYNLTLNMYEVNSSSDEAHASNNGGISGAWSMNDSRFDVNKSSSSINLITGGGTNDVNYSITHDWTKYNFELNVSVGNNISTNVSNLYAIAVDALNTAFNDLNISPFVAAIPNSSTAGSITAFSVDGYISTDINASNDTNTSAAVGGDGNALASGQTVEGFTIANDGVEKSATSSMVIKSLTSDLKYNAIWAPDFPTEDGPVFVLKQAGYNTKKILSAVEDNTGGISWSYIDLTAPVNEWFSNIDAYTMFTVDRERGYWAYLERDDSEGISIEAADDALSLSYVHHFNSFSDNTDSSKDLTADNVITAATLRATVNGLTGSNYNVFANVNGIIVPMVKAGASFTADFSTYEIGSLPETTLDVIISAYDEYGNMAKTEAGDIKLDNEPPARPTVTFNENGTLTLSNTSEDVAKYYIFSGAVYDKDPIPANADGSNLLAELSATDASFNYCQYIQGSASTSSFETAATGWLAFAVDGTGNIDQSRVSDLTYLSETYNESTTIYGIYNGSSILSSSGDVDVQPQTYTASCESSDLLTADNGVSLQALNEAVVTIAYEAESGASLANSGADNIIEAFIQVSGKIIAKIRFDKNAYVTNPQKSTSKNLFINYSGSIYRVPFSSLQSNEEESNAYSLTTDVAVGVTGQSIVK